MCQTPFQSVELVRIWISSVFCPNGSHVATQIEEKLNKWMDLVKTILG